MSVFRTYNPKTQRWEPIANADASTIVSGNPILTGDGTKSIEDILLRDRGDIELLKKNVSWLAKHGGGGGGYGPGGGDTAKATVQVLSPADNTTPVDSFVWKDNIKFIRVKITSTYTGEYKLVVKSNGRNIYEQQSVKRNTVVDVPTTNLNIGKTGVTLEVLAYDDAEMEYSATCKITVASVDLQKPDTITVTQNQLQNASPTISLAYRTSIPGNYRMYYSNTMITYDPNLGWVDNNGALDGDGRSQYIDMIGVGTTVSSLAIRLNDIYGDGSSQLIEPTTSPGIYSRYFVMVSANDPTICSEVQSAQIIVIVTNGLLVAPQLGNDKNEPYMISLDGILNAQFITYSSGNLMGTYSYSIWHGDQKISEAYNQIYGSVITVPITMNNIFDKEGNYELTIKATGGGFSSESKIYLNVVEATANLIRAYEQDIRNYAIFDYTFWDKTMDAVIDEATFVNNNFRFSGAASGGRLEQKYHIYNKGADSMNTKVFYSMNHTCAGQLDSNGYKWFPSDATDTTSLISGSAYLFTISLAYRINREVGDNATIFNLGNYNPTTLGGDGSGYGILVTAHGFFIHLEDTIIEGELSDNTFTQLDIVLKPHVNPGAYLLCVYQNGTLSKASEVKFQNNATGIRQYCLGDFREASVACRKLESKGNYYSTSDSINMDLYSVKMFSIPLNDGQIICNYINNRANFERDTDNNTLNPTRIMQMLTNNSIKPDNKVAVTGEDADGNPIYDTSSISSIFNMSTGEYNWGVSVMGSEVQLGNNFANMPIPVVVLDAYNWYFEDDFKGGNINTQKTDGQIRYMDGGKTITHPVEIELQGTTTLTYEMKNVDVTFKNATFTPKASWFPEQTFTLKADIVDSGHMNNAVIGTFVNKCLNNTNLLNREAFPVASKIQEYSQANGKKMPNEMTLKACIEGFPIVLIMSFLSKSGEAREAYVMGIYSFNLGRKSYVNQGFEVLKCLRNLDGTEANPDTISYPSLFATPLATDKDDTYQAYCYEGKDSYNCSVTTDDEIDINDNEAIYDYAKVKVGKTGTSADWHWYPKVSERGGYVYYQLQPITDSNNVPIEWNKNNVKKVAIIPNGYFWSNDESYAKEMWKPIYTGRFPDNAFKSFKELCSCVSSKLQYVKGLYSDATGKVGAAIRPYNTSYQQYKVTSVEGENFETFPNPGKIVEMKTPQEPEPIELSVRNAAFYYVVCMLFGLVDSFGKNMQMKNWALTIGQSQPRWSPTFYDMDTALGLDNVGAQSIPPTVFDESIINTPDNKVAFLYGSASQASNGIFTVFSNKLWGGLDNEMFQRQYQPDYGSETDYQVYSSMWSDLRRTMINNPDDFVDTYLTTQLQKCGEFLYNYDYDQKYTKTAQISMLHGTRVSYIKNWLRERITFLDSVFGYKTPNESTYLTDPNTQKTPPFITPYNVSWKNEAKLIHNTGTLRIPVTTNNTVIMRTTIGNSSASYTYVPKNIKTYIPVGQTLSTPKIQTVINNADVIIDMDVTSMDLIGIEGKANGAVTNINDRTAFYADYNTMPKLYNQYGSFASLKKLNLRNAALDPAYILDYFTMFKTWDSSPWGVSPEPFKLEELNLSGIKSTNVHANLSGLTESIDVIPSTYRAPFTNITKVDVSNSNISSVTIPAGVSLYDLNITNSKIQTLNLIDQPLLPAPDFNGCINLSNITMKNCGRFTSLTFNSTTKALQSLVITGCQNLETLTISGGDAYTYLPSISVEDCPKLKTIRIYGCNSKRYDFNPNKKILLNKLPSLETLNIANSHFEIIEWDGVYAQNIETGETVEWTSEYEGKEGWEKKGHANLKSLNISNSYISQIKSHYYEHVGGIDLRGFSSDKLTEVICSNNVEITEVHFSNDINNPFHIKTEAAFMACTKLERVYGYVVLEKTKIFRDSILFSIHGTEKEKITYNGKNVYKFSKWIHPIDLGMIEGDYTVPSNNIGVKFQEGTKVTNMRLGGVDMTDTFRNTACTTFDVYYTLMNLKPNVQLLAGLFSTITTPLFEWKDTFDNSPHRHMFARCGERSAVRDVQNMFHGNGGSGRLLSPYYDGDTFVPGLFTPLVNVAGYNSIFFPMAGYVCDRNAFRLDTPEFRSECGASGAATAKNKFRFEFFNQFTPSIVVNDVNKVNYPTCYSLSLNAFDEEKAYDENGNLIHGDLSGFFQDMPNVGKSHPVLSNVLDGVLFIDYDKFNKNSFGIPTHIDTLSRCLTSRYANGTLNLKNLFADHDASAITNLYTCIRVSNEYSKGSKQYVLNIPINESLFQDSYNLVNISYLVSGDEAATVNETAFSGDGVKKSIPKGNFPYKLLNGLNNLKSFVGFFKGCNMTDAEPTTGNLILPGDLFSYTPNIEDISYCFYDIKTNKPVKLSTDMPFKKCPKLRNVSYLFGHSTDEDAGKSSIREFQMPRKFFYHGGEFMNVEICGTNYKYQQPDVLFQEGTTIKTAYIKTADDEIVIGTNGGLKTETITTYTREFTGFDDVEGSENVIWVTPVTTINDVVSTVTKTYNADGSFSSSYPRRVSTPFIDPVFAENMKVYNFEYEELIRNISNFEGCFSGADFVEYSCNYNEVTYDVNSEYQPFEYVYSNETWSKVKYDNVKYTYEWVYDGDREKYLKQMGNLPKSEMVNGETYYYGHSMPDDAWIEGSNSYIEMEEQISTSCKKTSIGNWGPIGDVNFYGDGAPNKFCLPPDLFRYAKPNANISYMFYKCGMYSHNSNYPDRVNVFGTGNTWSQQAYGLTGRLCPYLLKPLYELTSLKGTFHSCSWLGGYRKNNLVYIIPESFLSYVTSSALDLSEAFACWSFPLKSTLNVFQFPKSDNITLNVENAFIHPYFLNTKFNGDALIEGEDDMTDVNNVFIGENIYIRGMKKCFMLYENVNGNYYKEWKSDQRVRFSNVFNNMKYDKSSSNADYYVFCGYKFIQNESQKDEFGNYINMRFGTKTVRDDVERHNYDAVNDPNK